ncbi:hypothetical protein BDV24DRAFT_170604 [Aspergillus arachidicola]|uniref:Uncharacterized protein n=1 Tax=Aspergillus arachidicola TaxID=656916 RepID=A0A5N6XLN3_9EURO|nr:hypothetical protein BDV24DRAFT_170604 [Aspergillus arachidicola]
MRLGSGLDHCLWVVSEGSTSPSILFVFVLDLFLARSAYLRQGLWAMPSLMFISVGSVLSQAQFSAGNIDVRAVWVALPPPDLVSNLFGFDSAAEFF